VRRAEIMSLLKCAAVHFADVQRLLSKLHVKFSIKTTYEVEVSGYQFVFHFSTFSCADDASDTAHACIWFCKHTVA
jgi:hypothetical protein